MALKAVVPNLDDVPAQFHELYTERNGQFEINGIEGLRTQADVDRLTTSLTKERNDHKDTKQKFAPFASLDIADVQAKLDRIPELEAAAAGKLDETKINDIVEGRIKGRLAPLERERDKLKTEVHERDLTINDFKTKETGRTIGKAIKAAAKKAGVIDEAVEDAIVLGERLFHVDESGNVVTKDNVGVTPGIDPTVWFTDLQPKRPHWWPGSAGGGAGGNNGQSPRQGANPWSHEHWNMTEQGKILTENATRAEQMAKAAGTKIGGAKPPARK